MSPMATMPRASWAPAGRHAQVASKRERLQPCRTSQSLRWQLGCAGQERLRAAVVQLRTLAAVGVPRTPITCSVSLSGLTCSLPVGAAGKQATQSIARRSLSSKPHSIGRALQLDKAWQGSPPRPMKPLSPPALLVPAGGAASPRGGAEGRPELARGLDSGRRGPWPAEEISVCWPCWAASRSWRDPGLEPAGCRPGVEWAEQSRAHV